MLLGRSAWTREPGGWSCLAADDRGTEALLRGLRRPHTGRTVLVFEPRGMAHPSVETPRVSRKVFATLSRVRSEHPVVCSDTLAWGMEAPETGASGSFETLIHYEMTPGLARVMDDEAGAVPVDAAWSAFTAAADLARVNAGGAVQSVLFVVPGFVAVACLGGRRSFRVWTDPVQERDWSVILGALGILEHEGGEPAREGRGRVGAFAAVVHGDPAGVCPHWDRICSSPKLASVFGLDEMADRAAALDPRHPANLARTFPAPRDLNRALACALAATVLVAAALCLDAQAARRRLADEMATDGAHLALLADRLSRLEANRERMDALRSRMGLAREPLNSDLGGALRRLAAAVPDTVVLASLSLSSSDAFRIEGNAIGDDFRPEETRGLLAGAGFESPAGGWVYDRQSRQLTVSGRVSAAAR